MKKTYIYFTVVSVVSGLIFASFLFTSAQQPVYREANQHINGEGIAEDLKYDEAIPGKSQDFNFEITLPVQHSPESLQLLFGTHGKNSSDQLRLNRKCRRIMSLRN